MKGEQLTKTNAVQLTLYFFLGSETRYVSREESKEERDTDFTTRCFDFKHIDSTPLTVSDFLHSLTLVVRPCVALPAVAHSMIFLCGSIMTSIDIPLLFPEKFGFNSEQVGLQSISLIIGTVIGEQAGGVLSDKWMKRQRKKNGSGQPEYRLSLSYSGYLLTIAGVAVFLVQVEKIAAWNVTPLLGAGIAAAGNQICTTVLITYVVDCFRDDTAAIGVFILFVRQTWGFIGPFW